MYLHTFAGSWEQEDPQLWSGIWRSFQQAGPALPVESGPLQAAPVGT